MNIAFAGFRHGHIFVLYDKAVTKRNKPLGWVVIYMTMLLKYKFCTYSLDDINPCDT